MFAPGRVPFPEMSPSVHAVPIAGPPLVPPDHPPAPGQFSLPSVSNIHLILFDPTNVYSPHAVEAFRFTDGSILTYAKFLERGFDLVAFPGMNTLTGTN